MKCRKLDLLAEVRKLLDVVFLKFGLAHVQIKECTVPGYLAFSKIQLAPFKSVSSSLQKAEIVCVEHIEIRLEKENSKDPSLLPMSTLVASVLHEMAHCISPQYKRKNKKNWYFDDHGSHFYLCFAKIMEYAEKREIFAMRNCLQCEERYGEKNLRNFDDVEMPKAWEDEKYIVGTIGLLTNNNKSNSNNNDNNNNNDNDNDNDNGNDTNNNGKYKKKNKNKKKKN